jgi:hypothetical protein
MYLFDFIGERDGIRTHDLLIKSQLAAISRDYPQVLAISIRY